MRTIKETLHEKRKTTEYHIKQLQHEGKQGIRYTAMMPDIPFLILGLMSDIGWLTHLIAGIIYFCGNGFRYVLDYAAFLALAGILVGVVYLIYLNKIRHGPVHWPYGWYGHDCRYHHYAQGDQHRCGFWPCV